MTTRQHGWAAGLMALGLAALAGCGAVDPWPAGPGKRVLVTFAPYYCFAKNVAGDDAVVMSLMSTTGPHEFTGSPRDALKVRGANVFFANGLVLDEAVAKKLKRTSGNQSAQLVELGEAVPLDRRLSSECDCEGDGDEKGHDHKHSHAGHHHEHGDHDPHVWMGPPEVVLMVNRIRDTLKELDPAHADGYDARAAAYAARLEKLHADGKELLKDKKERTILTFHESLGYFARAFDLKVAGFIEVQPGQEPGPEKLKELIALCKTAKVRVIAVEPQFPANTSAKAIRDELKRQGVDAVFVEIDTLETATETELSPEFYETRMRANLKALADTLQ
jgi:zinc transport system substrate-binding protein